MFGVNFVHMLVEPSCVQQSVAPIEVDVVNQSAEHYLSEKCPSSWDGIKSEIQVDFDAKHDLREPYGWHDNE
jgi:hypothetical protein